jgi:hypothetical protein
VFLAQHHIQLSAPVLIALAKPTVAIPFGMGLSIFLEMLQLPCFLCGKQLDLRTDRNHKRYVICNGCGLQAFVRRAEGIENLERLIRALKSRDLPIREHAHVLFEIRAILQELDGIGHELKKLDDSISIFSNTRKEKNRARKLLEKRMQTLLADLERIAG